MPKWEPEPKWQGEEVFIIGGGNSLRGFDWELLKPLNTIGCNTAFTLGKEVCDICIFGDAKWFKKYERELARFDGVVVTNCPQYYHSKLSWLWTMMRRAKGLHRKALGWNSNTGAAAINLALLLGARCIYLLGFDMHLSENGKPNWHDRLMDKPDKSVYNKFNVDFKMVAADLKNKFPGQEVINVTDDSDLNVFQKVSATEFWKERKTG